MDEGMEFAFREEFSDGGLDLDYEFDAVRYFDFSRPESIKEAAEAESWFGSAGSYPPSPFIIKLNWKEDIVVGNASHSSKAKYSENTNSSKNVDRVDMDAEVSMLRENVTDLSSPKSLVTASAGDTLKTRTKSTTRTIQSRRSTLMKPTASVLAKQNQPRESCSTRFQRFQNPLPKISGKNSKCVPAVDRRETKRQKLETGYLRKAALLKHQSLFVHKLSKKPGNLDHARLKVTVPKEPDLETAKRAHRHWRPKNDAESVEHAKSNAHLFKAHPSNRKIPEAPSLLMPGECVPQLPEFQVFHVKTAERAMQHASNNMVNLCCYDAVTENESIKSPRTNPHDELMDRRCERVHSFKANSCNRKELKFRSDMKLAYHLPELLNKLSLTSEVQPETICQPKSPTPAKASKENAPSALHQVSEMLNVDYEKPPRFVGKQVQCAVDRRILNLGSHLYISRSLDIR